MPDERGAMMRGRGIATVIILALSAALLMVTPPAGLDVAGWRAAIVAILMALLWMTELVPLAVTAMLPIVLFPLLGIAGIEATLRPYANPLIFLFLGGFMLAAALERWNLHRRLAGLVVARANGEPGALVLGMMTVTAFLSLWISNTATTMVMAPIALSIAAGSRQTSATPNFEPTDPLPPALLLGTAFAATIGGMGSLIGTPPNALLAGFVQQTYGLTIGFATWMMLGLPIVLVLIPATYLILTRLVFSLAHCDRLQPTMLEAQAPMRQEEWLVAVVLALTAMAWVGRPVIEQATGWTALSDAGIAITGAFALFLIPARAPAGGTLLSWEDLARLRWDVLLLFGGGLTLADAIGKTGLAAWIGASVGGLASLPLAALVLIMMVVIVYLGELASNTAVAAIFLPVAAASATGLGTEPLNLLLPVALAASLGFMLPVATPPNAIVYGTGAVSARQMMRAGAILDVVTILVVYGMAMLLAPLVLGSVATVH